MRRSARITIHPEALQHNLNRAKQLAPNSKILAVIKANAYGHGSADTAGVLYQIADEFAVSCVPEAVVLRDAGIDKPITILQGFQNDGDLRIAEQLKLRLTVHDDNQLRLLDNYSSASSHRFDLNIKIDSGMHRLGFQPGRTQNLHQKLSSHSQVNPDNLILMTHFSSADELENDCTTMQIKAFNKACGNIKAQKSIANSAGVLGWEASHTMSETLFDISGKTAIVTGASRGIGEAIAKRLAQHGANVVVSSRKIESCQIIADEINQAEDRDCAYAVGCNISHREHLQNLVDETNKKFGDVDILICNAAVNPAFCESKDISEEQIDKIFDCNIKSNHFLSHMVLPQMKKNKDGAIVIISSISAFLGNQGIGMYGVSKAADMQVARNLAVEFGPDNVRVNTIAPGVVKTYFAEALWKDPATEKMISSKLPMRRFGEPDDIAGAAVFLASPAAKWMTGQNITIDGGTMIGLGM